MFYLLILISFLEKGQSQFIPFSNMHKNTSTQPSCMTHGFSYQGTCFYDKLSDGSTTNTVYSCDALCADRGGCDLAGNQMAAASLVHCTNVANGLGNSGAASFVSNGLTIGCTVFVGAIKSYYPPEATCSDGGYIGGFNICACNN